ncbi:exported hypothetical protein [Capnocytophaga canimorsus]|uniref:Uncharacterized protein n=1 Tax=Capnocytophaga canimorsus TaxID=28188 RepID=A0A0B7IFI1_9FLAO|nr:exported hypothetical protein [Capnocytophaga canimorsus]
MKRRQFFKKSALAGMGSLFVPTFAKAEIVEEFGGKTPKNIILYGKRWNEQWNTDYGRLIQQTYFRKTLQNWISLYEQKFGNQKPIWICNR